MDVNKDVRESYQHLIKALPTDLLTRFVLSDSLLIIKYYCFMRMITILQHYQLGIWEVLKLNQMFWMCDRDTLFLETCTIS